MPSFLLYRFVVSRSRGRVIYLPLSSQAGPARPAQAVTSHRPLSKVVAGVKASNENHGQSGRLSRGRGGGDGSTRRRLARATRRPSRGRGGGDGDARWQRTRATRRLSRGQGGDDGGDGKCSAMSREQVARRRSESNRVTGTVGSRVASWSSGVGDAGRREWRLERRSWRALWPGHR